MLCINGFLYYRNYRYYEKKVLTVKVNHATYSNKRMLFAHSEPVPGFPTVCVVVFIVISDFEVRGGFVDIDGIVDHHGFKTFFS